MHHTELLYQLKHQKIQLWAKPDGNLGFSVDQQAGFPSDLKARVAAAKAELLSILRFNEVGWMPAAQAARAVRALLARQDMLRLKIGADMACDRFDADAFTVAEVEIDADQVAAECERRYQRPFQLD